MKPFDIEEAKAGKPVCTRVGDEVRILCFDRKCECDPGRSIVALYFKNGIEYVNTYYSDGRTDPSEDFPKDLFMKSQKREGWINIYKSACSFHNIASSKDIYPTKEQAFKERSTVDYIATGKVEWEE